MSEILREPLSPSKWEQQTPMPYPGGSSALAVWKQYLYAFGKTTVNWLPEGPVKVQRYDTESKTWQEMAPMLTGRFCASAAVHNGKIHLVGGTLGRYAVWSNLNECYDPETNRWEAKAAAPSSRCQASLTEVRGKLHWVGGSIEYQSGGAGPCTLHEVFDPETNTWASAQPLPIPKMGHAAIGLGGKLYVLGGEGPGENFVYDPAADAWSAIKGLDSPIAYAGIAAFQDEIYLIGGLPDAERRANNAPWNQVLKYTPATDRWQTLPQAMNRSRCFVGAGTVQNTLYAVGGSTAFINGADLGDVEALAFKPSTGPTPGDKLPPIRIPKGKRVYYSASAQADTPQFIEISNAQGWRLDLVSEGGQGGEYESMGNGYFDAVDPAESYLIKIGTREGSAWSQVLWGSQVLELQGLHAVTQYIYASEDSDRNDQDYNDSFLSLHWFDQIARA